VNNAYYHFSGFILVLRNYFCQFTSHGTPLNNIPKTLYQIIYVVIVCVHVLCIYSLHILLKQYQKLSFCQCFHISTNRVTSHTHIWGGGLVLNGIRHHATHGPLCLPACSAATAAVSVYHESESCVLLPSTTINVRFCTPYT
jgi:hypothetical protein